MLKRRSSQCQYNSIAGLIQKRSFTQLTIALIFTSFGIIGILRAELADAGQYSTHGHPKARGVNLTLSYPEGWLSRPGERPHMIQSFAARRPWGAAMAILGIRNVNVPKRGYFTDQEAEEYLSSKRFYVSQFGESPNIKIIGSKASTIESLPAILVQYEGSGGRLDQRWAYRAWLLTFIVRDALVQLDCKVMVRPEDERQLPHRMQEEMPHFRDIANSIVVENIWIDNTQILPTQSIVNDKIHKFKVAMPCDPIDIKLPIQDKILHTYNCYEQHDRGQTIYYVHASSRSDGRPIRYRKDDLLKAIRYDIIGFLHPFGGNQNNISFKASDNFINFSGTQFYSNQLHEGKIADGVGAFIDGQHIRIGIVYDPINRDQAQKGLNLMLDTFSRK